MMPAEDEFSDFCYLRKHSTPILASIIEDMNSIDAANKAHHVNGERAMRDIEAQPMLEPVRALGESDANYDKRMHTFASDLIANVEARLTQRWENCMTLCDGVLNYADVQVRAKRLMDLASLQKGLALDEVPTILPQHRDVMNALYADMKRLEAVPLQAINKQYYAKLTSMMQDMAAIKNRHEDMLQQMAEVPGESIHSCLELLVIPAVISLQRMEEWEAELAEHLETVPEMQNAAILTKSSRAAQGRGR